MQHDAHLELDDRARAIFRLIVDGYLGDGEPTGSRTLSRKLAESAASLSPATIRNVMSDLEHLGLIYAPHVSAGRLPTERGLRFFVDTLMETSPLDGETRSEIERVRADPSVEAQLARASGLLGSVAGGAGLVLAAKGDSPLRHIDFVRLDPERALVVLVNDKNEVENRVIDLPPGIVPSQLTEAANILNASLAGRTLAEARKDVEAIRERTRRELDGVARDLVERGLAVWSEGGSGAVPQLVVRGRGNLIEDAKDSENVERLRRLFDDLESKDGIIRLLDLAESGEGVRIFIGSENKLFSLSGSSLVVAPYLDQERRIVGAVGVIGPTRLNYARIVPVIDYTAKLLSGRGIG